MPADEVIRGTEVDESRVRTGPRHAAPRKPLFTRFHVPAGKAVAIAAMPTAVLMGMGFTPTLAQADDHSPAKSLTADEYQKCVEVERQGHVGQPDSLRFGLLLFLGEPLRVRRQAGSGPLGEHVLVAGQDLFVGFRFRRQGRVHADAVREQVGAEQWRWQRFDGGPVGVREQRG